MKVGVPQINTHHLRIKNGRHKGELFTRLPISYLKWMVQIRHAQGAIAQAELDRRGITTLTLDVSIHAVDRASEFAIDDWRNTRQSGEGFYSWLIRMAERAFKEGKRTDDPAKISWNRITWVFEQTGAWPTLKTVIPFHKKGP